MQFKAAVRGQARLLPLQEHGICVRVTGQLDFGEDPAIKALETGTPRSSSPASTSADKAHPQKAAAIARQTSQAPRMSRIPTAYDTGEYHIMLLSDEPKHEEDTP